jgi:hypothetical protein
VSFLQLIAIFAFGHRKLQGLDRNCNHNVNVLKPTF